MQEKHTFHTPCQSSQPIMIVMISSEYTLASIPLLIIIKYIVNVNANVGVHEGIKTPFTV